MEQTEIMMQLQMMQEQLKQLQTQAQMIENQSQELETARIALSELAKAEPNTPSLVQVASGVFTHAVIQDFSKMLVNVGGGIVVEKPRENVEEQLQAQLNALMQVKLELEKQHAQLMEKAQELHKKLTENV